MFALYSLCFTVLFKKICLLHLNDIVQLFNGSHNSLSDESWKHRGYLDYFD